MPQACYDDTQDQGCGTLFMGIVPTSMMSFVGKSKTGLNISYHGGMVHFHSESKFTK